MMGLRSLAPAHQIETPRLILRSLHASETKQLRIIRQNPKNNLFDALPDPETSAADLAAGIKPFAEQGFIDFLAVLETSCIPPGIISDAKFKSLKVRGGVAIGFAQICPPMTDDGDFQNEIGGVLDHDFWGMGLGTEMFEAVIDYAFVELGRDEMVLEAKEGNLGLRAVMRKLGLEELERPGKAWMGEKVQGVMSSGEESFRWDVTKETWEQRGIKSKA